MAHIDTRKKILERQRSNYQAIATSVFDTFINENGGVNVSSLCIDAHGKPIASTDKKPMLCIDFGKNTIAKPAD